MSDFLKEDTCRTTSPSTMETLLRPAKILAEWEFNFLQNLEKYCQSLKNSQNVNFGEAALVLQNSANVYARRVEYLWGDTESLGQSLDAHNEKEKGEEEKSGGAKKQKSRSCIDFNDFESLKLDDYLGKSNNLKENGRKNLKLLTRRFTQLENNLDQLSSPINILSIEGEIIGNKHDFRCNQHLTKNCMLVDELLPNDFALQINTEISVSTNVKSVLQKDSGFISIYENNLQAATPESINSDDIETNINNCTAVSLDQNSNIPHETDSPCSAFSDAEDDVIEPPPIPSSPTKPESAQITEKQIFQPIPFEQSLPDTIPKRRAEFKLPCHISLLKTKAASRKRKGMTEAKKRANITRCLLGKYELFNGKFQMDTLTRQLFPPKKEDLEEFEKSFDQYLKNMRIMKTSNYEAITTDATIELLGFQQHLTNKDLIADNLINASDNLVMNPTTIIEPDSDLSSVPESFTTPPPTPEAGGENINYRELVEQRMRQIGDETLEQSDLEQRVAEWHRSLRSKLTAAGRRPPFNINDYSSQIIEALEVSQNKTVPFSNLVYDKPPPEIARYFLASLQLANSYDIAVNPSADSDCCIELKLLRQGRHEPP